MYDPKCHELAEHFLPSGLRVGSTMTADLAQHIQDSVEDWLRFEAAKREREILIQQGRQSGV